MAYRQPSFRLLISNIKTLNFILKSIRTSSGLFNLGHMLQFHFFRERQLHIQLPLFYYEILLFNRSWNYLKLQKKTHSNINKISITIYAYWVINLTLRQRVQFINKFYTQSLSSGFFFFNLLIGFINFPNTVLYFFSFPISVSPFRETQTDIKDKGWNKIPECRKSVKLSHFQLSWFLNLSESLQLFSTKFEFKNS